MLFRKRDNLSDDTKTHLDLCSPLADSRQRLAERQIEDSIAANGGAQNHKVRVLFGDMSDKGSVAAERMAAHRFKHPLSVLARNEGDQFALIGDQQRIESENLAGSAHRVANWNRTFIDLDPRCWRVAISTRVAARPPRVGSRIA